MDENNTTQKTRVKKVKKSKNGKKILSGVLIIGILAIAGVYTVMANTYKTKFFPNTIINGIDASDNGRGKAGDRKAACRI